MKYNDVLTSSKESKVIAQDKCQNIFPTNIYEAPPSSLMDSIASPKVKTTEGEGIGCTLWIVALRG